MGKGLKSGGQGGKSLQASGAEITTSGDGLDGMAGQGVRTPYTDEEMFALDELISGKIRPRRQRVSRIASL